MKKSMIRFMALLLVALPLLGVFARDISAATSRVAVIKELKGTVKVKKAGGTKEFTAFAKMSLSEGDVLSTGKDSYAELQFANGSSDDDRMTVTDHSTLKFSKFSDGKGTRTKVSMLKGTSWFEVKSIKTKDDEFQLETPTAIMGVRGTKFLTYVNPVTGQTTMIVAAGVVSATTVDHSSATEKLKAIQVYPAQQISLSQRENGPTRLPSHPSVVQISDVINQAPPKIIEQIILSHTETLEENEKLKQKLQDEFNRGTLDSNGLKTHNGQVKDQTELDRVTRNFDNLIGNIAKEAVNQKKIDQQAMQKIIEEANKPIEESKKKLDLNIIREIDPGIGVDPELEIAKQATRLAQQRYAEEQRQLLENQQRLASLLAKIEEDMRAIDEANKNAAKEAAEKAADQLMAQLDEAARKSFEQNQKLREQVQNPPTNSGSVGGGGPGPSPDPGPGPGPSQASKLTSLSISSGTLAFDPNSSLMNYSVTVAHEVSSIVVTAASQAGSSIQINDQPAALTSSSLSVPLNEGPNVITVKVTEVGKAASSYTVTVTREAYVPPVGYYGVEYWNVDENRWIPLRSFEGDPVEGTHLELGSLSVNARKLRISENWSANYGIQSVNENDHADPTYGGFIVHLHEGSNDIEFVVEDPAQSSIFLHVNRGQFPEGVAEWSVFSSTYLELYNVGYNNFGISESEIGHVILDLTLEDTVDYVTFSYSKEAEGVDGIEMSLHTSDPIYPDSSKKVHYEIYELEDVEGPVTVSLFSAGGAKVSHQKIWLGGPSFDILHHPITLLDENDQEIKYAVDRGSFFGGFEGEGEPTLLIYAGIHADLSSLTIAPSMSIFPQWAYYMDSNEVEQNFEPVLSNDIVVALDEDQDQSEINLYVVEAGGQSGPQFKIILYQLPQDVTSWEFTDDIEFPEDTLPIEFNLIGEDEIPVYQAFALFDYAQLTLKSNQTLALLNEEGTEVSKIINPEGNQVFSTYLDFGESGYSVTEFTLVKKVDGVNVPIAKFLVKQMALV